MKIRNILFFVSAICLMASCSDLFNVDHTGESIKFGVSSGKKELLTRTEYTDDVFNGRERIDWAENDRVYIWMYWDENRNDSYESGPLSTEYRVEYNSYSQEKSYGSLISTGTSLRWQGDFSGNNGRAREYKHAFYSVYPSTWREFNGNDVKFSIPNSQEGVDMSLAYMTAYKDNVTSLRDDNNPDSYVDLEYYPRVTTLYITVVNDTDEAVGGEIKLSSSNSPITGDYFVSIPDYSSGELGNNNEGDKVITNTIKSLAKNESDIVAFFIRPRNYDSGELSLTFNGKTQSLNKALKPNYKYNIDITVSGDIEIGDGLAQLILSLLVAGGGHRDSWNLFEDFYRKYFNYTSDEDLNKGIWNYPETENGYTLSNNGRNATPENAADILKGLFPGDKLTGLLDFLGTMKTITIKNGMNPKLSCKEVDLSIFKSVENISLYVNQSMKITANGLDSLKTFKIIEGSNGDIDLIFQNCSIETISQEGSDGMRIKKLHLISTPNFRSAEIKNMNLSEMEIYLKDCSTSEKVESAYIKIENTNTKKYVKREGNTSKVYIENEILIDE